MWNNLVLYNAGSREGSYIVIVTADVWRTQIGCLAGDKLCFCVPSPYLALPQMPKAGASSALPPAGLVPLPQVPISQSLKRMRTNIFRFHQSTPSMLPKPRDCGHSFITQEASLPVSLGSYLQA